MLIDSTHTIAGDPGLMKNMITNSQSSDVGLLVVDGEQGVREQTREHLLLCWHLGVRQFVVFIDCKSDSALDQDTLDFVEMDVRDLFESKGIPLEKVS
jgi:translation elongation factor EF-Tu-like GTPase